MVNAKPLTLAALLAASLCAGQQTGGQECSPTGGQECPPHTSTQNKRMFGMMPAYGVVEPGEAVSPLKPAAKFRLASRYFDLYTFATVALRAGVEQAVNAKEEWGQGMEGYGKRYGADFADGLSNAVFVDGVFPSLLHQDPRYFRRGQGNFWARSTYAASRVLVTRQDSGQPFLNLSELLGNAASAGLSTAYYPESERTAGDFAVRAGIQFGFDAGFNVMKEFYPDIMRKVFHKKQN